MIIYYNIYVRLCHTNLAKIKSRLIRDFIHQQQKSLPNSITNNRKKNSNESSSVFDMHPH